MNRRLILVALLAAFVAACGTQEPSEADATPTPEPTPATTPEPTDEPAGSDGDGTALEDVIPDELNGVVGTPVPGMEAIFSQALQAQGLEGQEVEFAFVTYGTGTDAVSLSAFRLPGVNEAGMQTLARLISGAGTGSGVEAEEEAIDGKSVLRFAAGATTDVVYVYVAGDTAFAIVGEDVELAQQLVAELP